MGYVNMSTCEQPMSNNSPHMPNELSITEQRCNTNNNVAPRRVVGIWSLPSATIRQRPVSPRSRAEALEGVEDTEPIEPKKEKKIQPSNGEVLPEDCKEGGWFNGNRIIKIKDLFGSEPVKEGEKKPNFNYQYFRWCATVGSEHISLEQLYNTLSEISKAFYFQLERGNRSGYLHYQIVFNLKQKHRFNEVKNMLGCDKIHLEICHNWYASVTYCGKDSTRVAGPWSHDAPLVDAEWYTLSLRPWQKDLEQKLLTPRGKLDRGLIWWYWDARGGVGKSLFARYMRKVHGAVVLRNGKTNDLAFLMKNAKRKDIIIMDLSRTLKDHTNWEFLEQILDGYVQSGKYESAFVEFDPPHLVVFANFVPQNKESFLSEDRWRIVNLGEPLLVPNPN